MKIVFLDTMIYMHYLPVEDIDFLSILDSNEVTIMVPRITVQELDNQKDTNPSRHLRDRAGRALQKFYRWFEHGSSEIRKSSNIQYYGKRPGVDLAALGLDKDRGDDVLIATIIEYKKENPDLDVILITQDTGPKLTARDHDIATSSLPDSLRLKEELEPLEKENRELKRQIDKLKHALPKPKVFFISDEMRSNKIEAQLEEPLPYPQEEIDQKVSALREEYHYISPNLSAIIPEEECERYNSELNQYFENVKRYIENQTEILNERRHMVEIQFEIVNEGTGPARDLDIVLRFPECISVIRKKDLEKKDVREPNPPIPPRTQMELMLHKRIGYGGSFPFDSLTRPMAISPPFLSNIRPMTATRHFEVSEDGHEISGEIQNLKHNDWWTMPELIMKFDNYESSASFSVDYRIRVANLPDEISGKLHVKVSE